MRDFDDFLDTVDILGTVSGIADDTNSSLGYERGDALPNDKLTEYVATMSVMAAVALLRGYHEWLSGQI